MRKCDNVNKNCSLNHKCEKLCYEKCLDCTIRVQKELPCGHVKNDAPCGLDSSKINCSLPCNRILPCNHKCKAKCFEKCKACEINVS